MDLKTFLRNLGDDVARAKFAQQCGSSLAYMRLVAYGARQASMELAQRVELESGGAVKVEEILHDEARNELMRRFVALRAAHQERVCTVPGAPDVA